MNHMEKEQLNKLCYYRKMSEYYNTLYQMELSFYSMNLNLEFAKDVQKEYFSDVMSKMDVYDEERHYLKECVKSSKKYKRLSLENETLRKEIEKVEKKLNK